MSDFTPLPVGTVLDKRYELVEDKASRKVQDKHILGKGGMGAVYLAHDRRLNCVVAVKQTTVPSDILGLDAFRREASLLANLSHPAIPRVQDYFDDNDSYFLVMELVRGDNLEEARNKQGGKLPFEEVLNITFQLFNALSYLHTQEKNVIHRDIKPANLKLTAHGQLKLLDFGLAKGSAGLMTTNLDSILKGGTPAYAPPEQLKYFSTDARSDLFSAAATLYHLTVGERPAHCLIDREFAIQKGISDPLRLANEVNSNVPPEFALILHQALSLSPDKRPQSAANVKKLLVDWQKAEAENQRRAAEAERIRLQKEIEILQQEVNAERRLRFEEQKKREELERIRQCEQEDRKKQAERQRGVRYSEFPIDVPENERRLHRDAWRFAHLLVKEIDLYNEKKAREGRHARDLYNRLREAIIRSRELYDRRTSPQVVKYDYFHHELVYTLAEGDESRLGAEYPGAQTRNV